jgi:hypothetical protein
MRLSAGTNSVMSSNAPEIDLHQVGTMPLVLSVNVSSSPPDSPDKMG